MILGLKSARRAGEKQQEAEDKQEPHLFHNPNPDDAMSFRVNLEPSTWIHTCIWPKIWEARRGDGGSYATANWVTTRMSSKSTCPTHFQSIKKKKKRPV